MNTKYAKTIRDAIRWGRIYADRHDYAIQNGKPNPYDYIKSGDSPLWIEAFKHTLKKRGYTLVAHRVFKKPDYLSD